MRVRVLNVPDPASFQSTIPEVDLSSQGRGIWPSAPRKWAVCVPVAGTQTQLL
jgi:hypothetical protein